MPTWAAYITLLLSLSLGFLWGRHNFAAFPADRSPLTASVTPPVCTGQATAEPASATRAGGAGPLTLGPFEPSGELGVLRDHIPFPVEVMSHAAPATLALPQGAPDAGSAVMGSERLAGWVVDDRGGTLSGACLSFFPAGSRDSSGLGFNRVCTGGKGDFEVNGLPPSFAVLVEHTAFASVFVDGVTPAADRTFTLRSGGGVQGTVRDRQTGSTVSRWTATLQNGSLRKQLAGGTAELIVTPWPAGETLLQIDAPGYVLYKKTLHVPEGESLKQITLQNIEFELRPAAELEIRVADRHGDPVENALVKWKEADGRTDSRGIFVFLRGEVGRDEVIAQKGDRIAQVAAEVLARQTNRIDLVLEIDN